jgi:hypothetical protein
MSGGLAYETPDDAAVHSYRPSWALAAEYADHWAAEYADYTDLEAAEYADYTDLENEVFRVVRVFRGPIQSCRTDAQPNRGA